MPPKFMLSALRLADHHNPAQLEGFLDSLKLSEHSITVTTKSFNLIRFGTDGMRAHGGESHYRISASDVRIIERLGAGSSSVVFKALLIKERRYVAVKKINVFDRDTRHQMINDIKALADSQATPNLVAFYGAYHDPDAGQVSIVLEYMDGGSLADLLEKVGKIPENVLSRLTSMILKGLAYLHVHKHMVHRDIKPENILLSLSGEAKITDFGISTFIASTLSKCNTFLGTVPYMSPERLENVQYSFPADVWSLGICLVEAATGEYPYDAADQGAFELTLQVMREDAPLVSAAHFSPEFQDIVRLCLQKDPAMRPTTEQLLQHPFIRMYEQDPVNLAEFMQQAQAHPSMF